MYIKLLRFYNYIRKCEKLDPQKLKLINFNRIKKMAIYAFENVDYYRELYEASNFNPYRLSVIEDLAYLPAVEKNHFRNAPIKNRISIEYQNKSIVEMSTSGSTAQPLKFYTNRLEMSQQTLKWLYVLRKFGYKPTDNLIQIYRPLISANKNFIQNFGLFRRKIISIFNSMDNIIDELESTRVDVLSGIKSSLLIVGEELFKRNILIRPKILATTGEVLTSDDRKLLSKYYKARPVDIYASSETGNIAYTCPNCDYLHIHSDSIFINTYKSTDDVYITSLDNFVTPIVNYNLADKLIYLDDYDCGCGSRLPLIRNVIGRKGDIIISSSGRIYNSQYFTAILKFLDCLDQYKIVQKKDRSIVIKLKINKSIDSNDQSRIMNSVLEKFNDITVLNTLAIEFVDSFPVESGGKFRVIENEYIKNTGRQ